MSNKCFDGLRCSSLACVGDRCLLKEMTQHTETATPKRYDWFTEDFGGDSVMRQAVDGRYVLYEDYAATQAKLETARLELSAERDAVAQYIGERNELQRLADMLILCGEDEAVEQKHPADKLRALIDKNITLRTQLAQANGWLKHYELSVPEQHKALREQLVKAQNEAYQRGQNDQANHDGPIVNAAYRDGRNKALDEVLQGCARDLTDMMLESCNLMDVGLQDAAWAHRIRADQECVRYNIVLALKSPNSAEGDKDA